MLVRIIGDNNMNQEEITSTNKLAYSVDEVAKKTSLSKAYIRLQISLGRIKVRRFGRRVLVLDEDLRNFLQGD